MDESGVFSVEMQIELDTSVAQKRELIAHALLKDAAKVLMAELWNRQMQTGIKQVYVETSVTGVERQGGLLIRLQCHSPTLD